ncbi:MAG: hypothetical protein ACRC8Y_23925 [Chroococcales cyanobacterium]
MWSRKRFDIDYSDLIYGLFATLTLRNAQRQGLQKELEDWWISDSTGEAVACLSVRSGWDLLLQGLQLPPGSEVAMHPQQGRVGWMSTLCLIWTPKKRLFSALFSVYRCLCFWRSQWDC